MLYSPVFPIFVKTTVREACADLWRSSSKGPPSLDLPRGVPNDKDSVALEMFIPAVLPRMKQPDELAAFRVNSA
jgi:hypothetical protein